MISLDRYSLDSYGRRVLADREGKFFVPTGSFGINRLEKFAVSKIGEAVLEVGKNEAHLQMDDGSIISDICPDFILGIAADTNWDIVLEEPAFRKYGSCDKNLAKLDFERREDKGPEPVESDISAGLFRNFKIVSYIGGAFLLGGNRNTETVPALFQTLERSSYRQVVGVAVPPSTAKRIKEANDRGEPAENIQMPVESGIQLLRGAYGGPVSPPYIETSDIQVNDRGLGMGRAKLVKNVYFGLEGSFLNASERDYFMKTLEEDFPIVKMREIPEISMYA